MEESSHFSHKIYKSDPLSFKNYVGLKVNILTEDGTTSSGIVYTVDPVSESVVLLQGCQQNHLKIVFGHAIKNVEICTDKLYELPELFTTTPTNLSRSAVERRKNAVIKILRENRFGVKEENDIITVENILSIRAPYESINCICANSIILGRIQNLLSCIEI